MNRIHSFHRSFVLYSILFVAMNYWSCKGPEGPQGPSGSDGASDKQIRLQFMAASTGALDTAWAILSYPGSYLTRFSKDNYAGLDSIIFSAEMGSTDPGTQCFVELYNLTDSVAIAGSTLKTNTSALVPDRQWIYSGNILDNFPGKEITLTVRIRSEHQGTMVVYDNAVLFLYR